MLPMRMGKKIVRIRPVPRQIQNAFEMNSMRRACNIVTGRDSWPCRVANDKGMFDAEDQQDAEPIEGCLRSRVDIVNGAMSPLREYSTSDAAQDEFVQALPQIRSALPNMKQVPIRASPMTS